MSFWIVILHDLYFVVWLFLRRIKNWNWEVNFEHLLPNCDAEFRIYSFIDSNNLTRSIKRNRGGGLKPWNGGIIQSFLPRTTCYIFQQKKDQCFSRTCSHLSFDRIFLWYFRQAAFHPSTTRRVLITKPATVCRPKNDFQTKTQFKYVNLQTN